MELMGPSNRLPFAGYALGSLLLQKIPPQVLNDKKEKEAVKLFEKAAAIYSSLKRDFSKSTCRPPLTLLSQMSSVSLRLPLSRAQRENIYSEIFSVYDPKEPVKGLNRILADWVKSKTLGQTPLTLGTIEETFQTLKSWGRLDSERVQKALTESYLSLSDPITSFQYATALIQKLQVLRVPVRPEVYLSLFDAALVFDLPLSAQWAAFELEALNVDLPVAKYRAWIKKTVTAPSEGWTLSSILLSQDFKRIPWRAQMDLTLATGRTQSLDTFSRLVDYWTGRLESLSPRRQIEVGRVLLLAQSRISQARGGNPVPLIRLFSTLPASLQQSSELHSVFLNCLMYHSGLSSEMLLDTEFPIPRTCVQNALEKLIALDAEKEDGDNSAAGRRLQILHAWKNLLMLS